MRSHSIFEWNNGQYHKLLTHSLNTNLPQMMVNEGYSSFAAFGKILQSKAPFLPFSLVTYEPSIVDDKDASNSKHAFFLQCHYSIGAQYLYKRDDLTQKATLLEIYEGGAESPLQLTIQLDGQDKSIITTPEFLYDVDSVDVASFPSDYEIKENVT